MNLSTVFFTISGVYVGCALVSLLIYGYMGVWAPRAAFQWPRDLWFLARVLWGHFTR